ncbi:Ankyrin repeat domain-containing protein [Mycena venus]|uniref:Ankyrin repeat domain-containing protein n=1 Tax=Mycena venus TaxID=2733690 RepID=A0A8H6XVV9_9AGAR|nr:Ankyrin repeat domain-containing protein [Mycena venus]
MAVLCDLPPELILHTVSFLTREIILDPDRLPGYRNSELELVPDLPSVNALSQTNTAIHHALDQTLYDLCASVPILGKLSLLFGVEHQLENAVDRLVAAGVSLDTEFWFIGRRCRSLHIAAAMGHRSMVLKLLELYGDRLGTRLYNLTPRSVRFPPVTALDYAAQRGHMDIVRLLAPIPMLSSSVSSDSSPCSSDVSNGVQAADTLETHKQYLGTALLASARAGNNEISEYLVSEGADVNFRAARGTPLHWAAGTSNLALVKFLLASGANPNLLNQYGITALFNAAENNSSVEIVQALVTAGADIHVKGLDMGNVLDHCEYPEPLRFFLERGVDPNNENDKGRTPLSYVCTKRNPKALTELLLQFGAGPVERHIESLRGSTVVDIAMNNDLPEVVKILEPHIENPTLLEKIAKWRPWRERKKTLKKERDNRPDPRWLAHIGYGDSR